MRRLLLVRHATTDAVRRAAFPVDEPLDERGRAGARELGRRLGRVDEAYSSASRRARETALAAGLDARTDEALAECDFGRWHGRELATLHESEPEGVAAWLRDPHSAPHGGESLAALCQRLARWLDEQAERSGSAVAVTHGGPLRAAVVHALGAPLDAFWRLDAAPLAITELHAHDGRWTLTRLNWQPERRTA